MSLVADILEELWNSSLSYKGWRVNIFGVPKFKSYNYNSLRSTLSRLKKDNYISKDGKGWYITDDGKRYYKDRLEFRNFNCPFEKGAEKNLLLMFDIPQQKNSHRDWLRRQLKEFGYVMIQKSVWIGPSPLPKEFLLYVKEIGIKNDVKTFKLAKGYRSSR